MDLVEKVGLSAAALGRSEEFGSQTQLAEQFGVSRPTVQAAKSTAAAVLTQHFEMSSGADLWLAVDDEQIRRTVVALRVVAPNSLRAIES